MSRGTLSVYRSLGVSTRPQSAQTRAREVMLSEREVSISLFLGHFQSGKSIDGTYAVEELTGTLRASVPQFPY